MLISAGILRDADDDDIRTVFSQWVLKRKSIIFHDWRFSQLDVMWISSENVVRNVEEISLCSCRLNDADVETLSRSFGASRVLWKLTLDDNELSGESATLIASHILSSRDVPLRTLSLRRNRIGEDGALSIGSALMACESMEELDLTGNGIQNYGAIAIAFALKNQHSIRVLRLGENAIESSGFAVIADCIAASSSLVFLDIQKNNFASDLKVFGDAMKTAAKGSSLHSLDVSENDLSSLAAVELFAGFVASLGCLESLQCDGCGIDDDGMSLISGVRNAVVSFSLLICCDVFCGWNVLLLRSLVS